MVAPAHVPDLRQDRVLRLLTAPARLGPCPHRRASHHPLRGAGRGLELVFRGRGRVRGGRVMTAPGPLTVGDIMRPPVTTVQQEDHVAAAAYLMKHAGATALMVLD